MLDIIGQHPCASEVREQHRALCYSAFCDCDNMPEVRNFKEEKINLGYECERFQFMAA